MTDEFEFSEEHRYLRRFDASLRCNICKELFTTPVSLRCGHCFCSECLRIHIQYASKHHFDVCCPDCRQVCHEGDIRPIVTFSTSMDIYKDLRPNLLNWMPLKTVSIQDERKESLEVKSDALAEDELIVPPVLHMNSLNTAQLRKRLVELKLMAEGNKQELMERYKGFRTFVQIEKDKGRKTLSLERLAKEFNRKRRQPKRTQVSLRLDGMIEKKTHLDLVKEIREREQRPRPQNVQIRGPRVEQTDGRVADIEETIENELQSIC